MTATKATAAAPGRHLTLDLNPIFRKGILAATQNPAVAGIVRAHGMRLGAARFVAGETLDEAVPVLRQLNERGLRTNTTMLGEGVRDEATARAVASDYLAVLDRIAAEGLTTNIALKLTHLGLDLGEDLAYANVAAVAARAAQHGNFVRIDMEESARVDATLRIYLRLLADGHANVGTVLQSCLRRTPDDLAALLPLRPNLRLVKGAYLEPAAVADPDKVEVDAAYVRLADRLLTEGGFAAIATHDERIIDRVLSFADRQGIGDDRFEIQMLYGIRPQRQIDLAKAGRRVLVATPFGSHWYHYLMRRLAERPANLAWLASNLARR
ncbi:MAG: proline dehydrogenase family protein [Thermomicrobiales bacterium]|nr:proline dehydrogenase family protein [Thermomicrobiales bacterium]